MRGQERGENHSLGGHGAMSRDGVRVRRGDKVLKMSSREMKHGMVKWFKAAIEG